MAKYLADQNYIPAAYAGASIGALNASFLGTASTFQAGVKHLEQIWGSIQSNDVVKLNKGLFVFGFLHALFKRSLQSRPELALVNPLLQLAADSSRFFGRLGQVSRLLSDNPLYSNLQKGLLDDGFLRNLLEEELALYRVEHAAPIWISAYASQGTVDDILAYLLSNLGIKDNPDSEYFKLSEIDEKQRLSVILASAAIPVVYGSHIVEGKRYIDGGVGGERTARGNTPLAPLVASGCRQCIVVNLSDGAMFNRHDFPDTVIIEVRPETSIHPDGMLSSLLDFREDRIKDLISMGYSDAERCIGNALLALNLVQDGRRSTLIRDESIRRLENDGFDEMLKKL
nr:patatin-like phospholipase family protein [Paenibacillus tianjinensis]